MYFYASTLATILLTPPTPTDSPAPAAGYESVIVEVEGLNEDINLGKQVRGELHDALSKLPPHAPELASDAEGRMIRTRAQLNLARAYLSAGDRESASGVMDEVLRSTVGEELPVAEFGPSLAALHTERVTALEAEGTASIAVHCQIPCRVYVNERSAQEQNSELYLGVYRVWIEAKNPLGGADESLTARINLTEANETASVEFVPLPKPTIDSGPKVIATAPRRVMPRDPEIALVVVGIVTTSLGALLLGLNQQDDPGRSIAGATLAGLGGAALLVGGVTLTVDEVRLGDRRGRQAMVGWKMSF